MSWQEKFEEVNFRDKADQINAHLLLTDGIIIRGDPQEIISQAHKLAIEHGLEGNEEAVQFLTERLTEAFDN